MNNQPVTSAYNSIIPEQKLSVKQTCACFLYLGIIVGKEIFNNFKYFRNETKEKIHTSVFEFSYSVKYPEDKNIKKINLKQSNDIIAKNIRI